MKRERERYPLLYSLMRLCINYYADAQFYTTKLNVAVTEQYVNIYDLYNMVQPFINLCTKLDMFYIEHILVA